MGDAKTSSSRHCRRWHYIFRTQIWDKGLCCSRCILQSTNLYDIYHFFLGALAVLLSAQPRPWACGMHKPQPLTGIQMRSLGSLGLGSASIFNPFSTPFMVTLPFLAPFASQIGPPDFRTGLGAKGHMAIVTMISTSAVLPPWRKMIRIHPIPRD